VGFTMVESLMALTILAVGLLAMLGLQLQALRQAEAGRHGTRAAAIAQDQIETFSRLAWSDAQLQPTAWTAPVAVATTVQSSEGDKQQQSFNLSWRITADAGNTNLRHIDVRVLWREADQQATSPERRYAISSMKYND
jgi:type IV pilus assembly protein PilV